VIHPLGILGDGTTASGKLPIVASGRRRPSYSSTWYNSLKSTCTPLLAAVKTSSTLHTAPAVSYVIRPNLDGNLVGEFIVARCNLSNKLHSRDPCQKGAARRLEATEEEVISSVKRVCTCDTYFPMKDRVVVNRQADVRYKKSNHSSFQRTAFEDYC
jgi:hypothetical protein